MMPYLMFAETDVWRGELAERLRDSGELTHDDPRGLIIVAFVPPKAAFDPPAILALVVEQSAAPAAHVVFELYLRILLHTHLDCGLLALVPWTGPFFRAIWVQN
jgi:hypothetical protein